MKKFFLSVASVTLLIASSSVNIASGNGEYNSHFVTKTGKHMCGKFMKADTFRPCEEVGIIHDWNGNVVEGKKPFFYNKEHGIFIVGEQKICVKDGLEQNRLSDCDREYYRVTEKGSTKCTVKNWSELCELVSDTNIINFTASKENTGAVTLVDNTIDTTSSVSKQAACTVNGKMVDCDQMVGEAVGVFATIMKFVGWIILVSVVGFVFWIVMLVHACSNQIEHKGAWIGILVMSFFFWLTLPASIVYYFCVKRPWDKRIAALVSGTIPTPEVSTFPHT